MSTTKFKPTRCDDTIDQHRWTPLFLDLVRDGLVLLDGVGRALLVVALVGQLGVVLDVRNADFRIVSVEDAGDFLESGAPAESKSVIKVYGGKEHNRATTYLVST
jgi:hypothetical protein